MDQTLNSFHFALNITASKKIKEMKLQPFYSLLVQRKLLLFLKYFYLYKYKQLKADFHFNLGLSFRQIYLFNI